jgi:hypothetical protein
VSFGNAITKEQNPAEPELLSGSVLFAIIKTWMDEDVIEATVRNALVQGAHSVFVIDNGSTDHTIQIAESSGATIAEVYDSQVFDGRLTQTLMNAVVGRESLRCGADHVWWLYLDSDEFPEGPGGISVAEYLATLDRRFRVVGAKYVNHVPNAKPEYLPGFHPVDFQPLCYEFAPVRQPPCDLGHWKHPLQRFDRSGHFVLSSPGAHSAVCSDPLIEPIGGIITHHFQYRDEELTRAKLELTCGPSSERTSLYASRDHGGGFRRRHRSLDAIYSGRWADVDTVPNLYPKAILDPRPWADLTAVRRWYEIADVEAARSRWVRQRNGNGSQQTERHSPFSSRSQQRSDESLG